MNTQDTNRMSRRKARRRTELAAGLVILFLVAAAAGLLSTRYIGSTMRLLNAVGVVEIEDNEGKPRAAVENVRFQSGEAMRTGEESLASISLDSSKIITMDENSRVEFKKRLNHIELLLTEGGLLFDVSKKLRDNETFDIRTSTMAVGIRGTIGYVYVDPENQETTLWMLESVCEVVGINPVTRETKTVSVRAGQKVHTYLFNDREIDSIVFGIEEFTWEDIPRDVQEIIERDSVGDNLYMRVMGACGWADDSSGEAAAMQPEAAAQSQEVQGWTPIPEAEEIQEEEPSQSEGQADEESIAVDEQKSAEPAQESYAENAPVPSQPEETAEQQAASVEHVHQYVMKSGVAASCTSGGWTQYSCECGENLITNTDPLGHLLTEHKAVEATCSSEGNTAYWTCSRCGKYFSDAAGSTEITEASVKTPKGNHSLVHHETVAATCKADGNIEYWTCSICGKYFSDSAGKTETSAEKVKTTGSHELVHHAAVAATCEADGNIEYWTCSTCGKYFSDSAGKTETSAAKVKTTGSHELVHHAAVAATCKADGNIEYWTCSTCGKYFSDSAGKTETSAAKVKTTGSHELVHHAAVAATCEADGNIEYWTCSVCNKYFSDSTGDTEIAEEDIATTGSHSLTHHDAVEATCVQDGNVEYWQCSLCGLYFADVDGTIAIPDESVFFTGDHIWTEITGEIYPSKGWGHYREYQCSVHTDVYKADPCCIHDHIMEELEDEPAAPLYEMYYCSTCNDYYNSDLGLIRQCPDRHAMEILEEAPTEYPDAAYYCPECDKYYCSDFSEATPDQLTPGS